MDEKPKTTQDDALEKVENQIAEVINNEGVKRESIEYLYKLVDIHKDLKNEKYWEKKEDNMMRYNGNYSGEYGARMRDSRGRYMGDYGRRGVPGSGRGRYRGYGYLDEMAESYGNYNAYSGEYGADQEGTKALEHMLKSAYQFMKMLKEEAGSQEEMEIIQEYAQRIGDM